MKYKYGPGPPPDPNSLRRVGWRPPPIDPAMQRLLVAIIDRRGGTISGHIALALIRYATLEEAENADLAD